MVVMNNPLALLLSDTYKQTHDRMYPKGLTKLVSYWVPRKSMLESQDKMVFFGLQEFLTKYLNEYFTNNFFMREWIEVEYEYREIMNIQIGEENYDLDKIKNLHRIGYLPLEIRALPEGTLIPMGVPCIEISNTLSEFSWLVQWIECILQVELWKPCCHTTIGYMYHKIAKKWYDKTVTDGNTFMACADFGMRGMSCMEEAIRASASWLLSFNKTSTIPAIEYIAKYYDADCEKEKLGIGAVSTEHSVMGANFAIDGDEVTFIKRLLTELYPNTSFSMVSDTYDYWNLVNNLLPQVKDEIMNHNGKLLIRPDSGNIVDISVRTVEKLWEIFGGTTNSKGYKVLDPHIGIIYGDGCTMQNVDEIWGLLEERGFAANNINYGVGAFCFSAIIENGRIVVVTRDTFGIAMKATYGVINDQKLMIYKDPKTDTEHLKKSHKGCCKVFYDENGEMKCQDEYLDVNYDSDNLLVPVYRNGRILQYDNFMDIRKRMYPEEV
jgi:nicotinamide phosphoribosyltransferase